MNRKILAILLAAVMLAFGGPRTALAQSGADIEKKRGWIDSYLLYMTDTSQYTDAWTHPETGGQLYLRNGIYPYVEDWVGYFQRIKSPPPGPLPLWDYAPRGVSSADLSYGESINGFYSYCFKRVEFIKEVKTTSDKISSLAAGSVATEAIKTELATQMTALVAVAVKAITEGEPGAHGVCGKALADIYYALMNVDGDKCMGNLVADPMKRPYADNALTRCQNRPTVKAINLGTLPNCNGGACKGSIDVGSGGTIYYNFKPARKAMDDFGEALKTALEAINKKVDEVGGQVATAQKSADQLKADILARGTALSLPLPLSDVTLEGVIGRVLNAILGIVGAIALLMFVWGGVTWMTAAGNQEKVGKAKTTLTWATIGLIAIFSSYAVLNLVIETFTK